MNGRKILQKKKTNVVNAGKEEIKPANEEVNNEEDEDGLMIENEAKDKVEELIE